MRCNRNVVPYKDGSVKLSYDKENKNTEICNGKLYSYISVRDCGIEVSLRCERCTYLSHNRDNILERIIDKYVEELP